MMSLAEKRHHERRHKKKALKIVKSYDGVAPTKRRVGITATTKCNCSCWMCNKPRKVFGDPFTRCEVFSGSIIDYAEKELQENLCIIDDFYDSHPEDLI